MANGGAGGGFEVELDVLRAKANHVTDLSQRMKAQINQLTTQIEGMRPSWQGDAANSHQRVYQTWQQQHQQLTQSLTMIGDGLMGNFRNYLNTEQANIVR